MGRIPPWSDLPQELLAAIANCLYSNPIDIQSFRSVCKSWRASSLSAATSPFTLFPPLPLTTPAPPYSIGNLALLSVTVVYALHPPIEKEEFSSCIPRAWFLFVDQFNSGKVSIRKPFSEKSYSMPINFPRNLNLLSFHASEMGRVYNLTKPLVWSGLVLKVVLFSNCNGSSVVTLFDEGRLGLLRLGLGDNYENLATQTQWEIIHDGKGYRFDDIVDFQGRILGIDSRGRLYEIEIGYSSPVIIKAIVPPITGGGGRRKRLVASLGRLHLVVRCKVHRETDAIYKVYDLNEYAKKWVQVKSLGDQTFFLGLDFSFSVPAEELHGSFGKNCILFKERSFLNYSGNDDDDSALFHKLNSDDLRIGVWNLEDAAHLGVIGSHPGYSNVLWPPPSWIWPINMSERVVILLDALDQLQVRFPHPDDKFKAKFKDLTMQQQEGAILLMKLRLQLETLQEQGREIFKVLKELEMIAAIWQYQSQFVNMQNQVGTSSLGTEERRVSLGLLHEAVIEHKVDFDWHSIEMRANACLFRSEEKTSELEDFVKLHDFSEFMVDGIVE